MFSPEPFSADHLYLTLKASRLQLALNLVVHLGALAALWYNPIFPVYLKYALSVALGVSATHAKTCEVDEVLFRAGAWKLLLRDGSWQSVELTTPLHVGFFFVVLGFRSGKQTFRVVVGRDTCQRDSFRRLVVFCHHAGPGLLSPVRTQGL